MPFQVIQQTFVDRKEPVLLVDVVDPQFFICNFGFIPIALTGTIIGNPSGHVFEWEVLEFLGNPLIPNPSMTTGSIFGPGDGVLQTPPFTFNYVMEFGPPDHPGVFSTTDMYFKFWVDRGTPDEQCLETQVFFTPTSFLGTGGLQPPAQTINPLVAVSGINNLQRDGIALLLRTSTDRISNLTTTPANPLTPQCIGGKISDKFLTWTVGPGVPDNFIDLTVLENAAGTFVPVATITDPSIIYYTGTTLGNSYKLIARYDEARALGKSPFISSREIGPIYLDTSDVTAAFSPVLASLTNDPELGQVRVENYQTFLITVKTILADLGPPAGDIDGEQVLSSPSQRRPEIQTGPENLFTMLITLKIIVGDLGPPVADFEGQFTSSGPSQRLPEVQQFISNYNVLDLGGGDIGGG